MKSTRRTALVAALCLLALASPRVLAAQGVLIVQKTTTGAKVDTNRMQVEKDRMRVETTGANGEKQIVVFNGPKQVLQTINVDDKSYTEMTKADVDAMGAQMSDAMAKMQEQMASLPPAQRAQMEAMMRGRMGGAAGAAAPKPEFRKTGSDRVGKWACDKYDEYLNGQKVSELCTADPKAIGLAMSDLEITRQLAEFFKGLAPDARNRMPVVGTPEAQGYSGFPVRIITYMNGQVQSTTEFTDVTRQSFPASSYEIPAGYTKKDSPMQGMPGRRGAGGGRGRQ